MEIRLTLLLYDVWPNLLATPTPITMSEFETTEFTV